MAEAFVGLRKGSIRGQIIHGPGQIVAQPAEDFFMGEAGLCRQLVEDFRSNGLRQFAMIDVGIRARADP